MLRLPSDSLSWTLMEKIRLLELFMNKDILWEGRAEILQNEFTQRPSNFFTVQNIRQELHQIFITPNPEHVYGLPLHPRGKEAAEMWLKHFRKELTKQRELQKQMFAVSMRRHLDLIKRFQQGKLPRQEIEAILTEARERDAQRPDRELYEAKLKEMLDKIRLDDLDNIRTFSDYYSYLRGERVPTPPPEPVEKTLPKSPTPDLLKSPLHSPELILKEPMTSTKAAQINALETELIEPTQTIKQSQRRRQKSTSQNSQKGKLTKTQQKKPQQLPTTKTAIEALPPPPRNLRSSTAKKKIEVEKEVATTILKTEEEENKTVAEVEDVAIPAFVGSKKRKRNVIEFLKPPMTDTSDQIHEEGPPAKNLRRSSHSSPSSQTSTGKKSSQSVTVTKQESSSLIPEVPSSKEIEQPTEAPIKIEQEVIEHPVLPIRTPPPPLQLSTPTLHSQVAATAKLRSSLRRAALASATPSPAVDSVGTNGLFLRPGNHSSSEVIPKEVLLTLWKDIRTHRHSYVFDQPVEEEEVPGYHSAIKKPMDLNTLCQLIESSTIQTFSQFTHHILKIFANAVMYNSTGHHVNTCAKEMLAYALKCIEVVQYPSGQWSAGIFSTPVFGTSVSRQSIASESDGPFDGQLSRSSSGISCSQTPSTSNATKTSTQQKLLRSSSINKRSRETSKTKAIPSPASSSTSSHSETKKEPEDDKQISIVPKNETLPKKRKLHRT